MASRMPNRPLCQPSTLHRRLPCTLGSFEPSTVSATQALDSYLVPSPTIDTPTLDCCLPPALSRRLPFTLSRSPPSAHRSRLSPTLDRRLPCLLG